MPEREVSDMKQEHRDALEEMGITAEVLAYVRKANTQDEGEKRLAEAKLVCKKGFRALALKLHPDVNNGEDKRFRFVKVCYEDFMKAKYKGARKQPKVQGFNWGSPNPYGVNFGTQTRPFSSSYNRGPFYSSEFSKDLIYEEMFRNFRAEAYGVQEEVDQAQEFVKRASKQRREAEQAEARAAEARRNQNHSVEHCYTVPGQYHPQVGDVLLSEGASIWRRHLGKAVPNPDIEKLRIRKREIS